MRLKKLYLLIISIVILVLALLACSKSGDITLHDEQNNIKESTPTPEPTPAPTPEPEPDPFDDTIWEGKSEEYKEMIKNSYMMAGNNYRVKKAIEKAKRGEEVTIGFIGGSITEGYNSTHMNTGYAYLAYEYFKETYGVKDKDNVKYLNAGMSGTPSTLGMIRYKRDVLDPLEGSSPDILFVEFAVNDGDDPTNGQAYESLVLNALQAEDKPAVVLLFAIFQSQWNLQDRLQFVGYRHELPMISIKNAIIPEIEAGRLTNKEFFADEYHPTDYGHSIMADCIKYYFSTVNSELMAVEDIDTSDDVIAIGDAYVGVEMFDSSMSDPNILVDPGSFTETDTALGTFRHSPSTKTFPNNWKHGSSSGSDSFIININCKNLLLVYKSSSQASFGRAEVYVDGELVKTVYSNQGGGWNNPYTILLFKEDTASMHNIEIKMAEGDEDKEFSILAFGYTR